MPEPLPQLTEDDVRNMSPEAIVAARKAGQLNEYLGVPVQPPSDHHSRLLMSRGNRVPSPQTIWPK